MLAVMLVAPGALRAADGGERFASPEDAVSALKAAVNANDTNALRSLFGPAFGEIENSNPVEAAQELRAFGEALRQATRIMRESDSRCVLESGEDPWPFPVPIVEEDGRWFFDTEAGREEIVNRRIGRNELMTLRVARGYVGAQREYAARDRDGDEVLEYAERLRSSPGTKDGLYWPLDLGGDMSPLGPFAAQAQSLGYAVTKREGDAPQPFHGYFFRILTRQGKHAAGGKYDYVINGNMIGGFALVAWPATYGETGIMTFVVNQQGRVYQKDLGPDTARLASRLKAYDPDPTWSISPD